MKPVKLARKFIKLRKFSISVFCFLTFAFMVLTISLYFQDLSCLCEFKVQAIFFGLLSKNHKKVLRKMLLETSRIMSVMLGPFGLY